MKKEHFNAKLFCERATLLFGDVGQVELSQKIGIAQGVISAIKNKKSKTPTADTVFKIAKYFDVNATWLLGLSDDPENMSVEIKETKILLLGKSDPVSIGKRIRLLRRERRLAQEDLAKILCVHRESISQIENAERQIRSNQVVLLADALGISCDYILRGRE